MIHPVSHRTHRVVFSSHRTTKATYTSAALNPCSKHLVATCTGGSCHGGFAVPFFPSPQTENLLNILTLGYPHQTSMILDKRVPPQTSMLSIKVPFINLLEVKPPQRLIKSPHEDNQEATSESTSKEASTTTMPFLNSANGRESQTHYNGSIQSTLLSKG